MTTYRITSSMGVDMGTWTADSPAQAAELMRRQAGYASSEDAAEALGTTVEALDNQLTITEVNAGPVPTKEPIQDDGWYENIDGSWSEYTWRGGFPHIVQTRDRPETSNERDARYADDDHAYQATKNAKAD